MNNAFVDFAVAALELANEKFNHDPLRGHTSEYERTAEINTLNGYSVFEKSLSARGAKYLVPYLLCADSETLLDLVPGANGAMIWVYGRKDRNESLTCGWISESRPVKGMRCKVTKIHGSLQLTTTEDVKEEIKATSEYSFVFTPELVDGETRYVLASIHPGRPDPTPDYSGLKEGDVIDGEEALNRKIFRVKKI